MMLRKDLDKESVREYVHRGFSESVLDLFGLVVEQWFGFRFSGSVTVPSKRQYGRSDTSRQYTFYVMERTQKYANGLQSNHQFLDAHCFGHPVGNCGINITVLLDKWVSLI